MLRLINNVFDLGYPAQDYINGIPRKTALCLSFSPEKFHNFMIAIYPKLEDRMYDMYRIDKTRRLIRIEVKSPRQLKDMKYQGSVIIIPYVSNYNWAWGGRDIKAALS